MDANRRQSGIQQLLAAEQEAQQIVNAARAGNTYDQVLSYFWHRLLQIKHSIREYSSLYFEPSINLYAHISYCG